MSYFSESINRFDTCSLKWNVAKNELPMWVADMDFRVAKEITQALQETLQHGIFGYSVVPDSYFESIIAWWHKRYYFAIQRKWLLFARGIIPAISCLIRHFSDIHDGIVLQSPVYHVFYHCIRDNQRQIIDNPLIYHNGTYSIDFEDLEYKLSKASTKIFLLCSPHNPIGQIWDKKTLQRIGHLCAKHNVLVIADEIHCDITTPHLRYTPFASIDSLCAENSITTLSPSKSFNIADLQVASLVIPNDHIRKQAIKALQKEHVHTPNIFGLRACIAAYTYCEYWLESLLEHIEKNKQIVRNFIEKDLPCLKMIPSNATYLAWIDCSQILSTNNQLDSTDNFCETLRERTGLYVSKGSSFGENGKGFFRMNIATTRERLEDGLTRLKNGIES